MAPVNIVLDRVHEVIHNDTALGTFWCVVEPVYVQSHTLHSIVLVHFAFQFG